MHCSYMWRDGETLIHLLFLEGILQNPPKLLLSNSTSRNLLKDLTVQNCSTLILLIATNEIPQT